MNEERQALRFRLCVCYPLSFQFGWSCCGCCSPGFVRRAATIETNQAEKTPIITMTTCSAMSPEIQSADDLTVKATAMISRVRRKHVRSRLRTRTVVSVIAVLALLSPARIAQAGNDDYYAANDDAANYNNNGGGDDQYYADDAYAAAAYDDAAGDDAAAAADDQYAAGDDAAANGDDYYSANDDDAGGNDDYAKKQQNDYVADDDLFHWNANVGFDGVSVMPLSCIN